MTKPPRPQCSTRCGPCKDPDLHKDIVELGFVKNLKIDGGRVAFTIELTTPACPVKDLMRDQAQRGRRRAARRDARRDRDDGERARRRAARARTRARRRREEHHRGRRGQGRRRQDDRRREPRGRAGRARQPRRACSTATCTARTCRSCSACRTQLETDGKKIVPAERYGLQVVSMGFLTEDDAPVIWRGPMLHGAIQQFFRDVAGRTSTI